MTKLFNNNVTSAKFIDEDLTTIEVLYGVGDETISYALQVDPESGPFKALIEEGWDLDKITKETIRVKREESRVFNDMVDYWVNVERIKLIEAGKVNALKVEKIDKSEIFNFLNDNDDDEEAIFKLKLAIFEVKKIKDIKDRSGKLKIRKAKTVLDTLVAYHALINKEE